MTGKVGFGVVTLRQAQGDRSEDHSTVMNEEIIPIRRALISVFNKSGIVGLAEELTRLGVRIISTGGTAKVLTEAGIPTTGVSEVTGSPEIMDGRVKTLHPNIHGGILGLRDSHESSAQEQGIPWIDLVVCNLYPFDRTILRDDIPLDEVLEDIDIGGPAMIRSAAKNVGWVGVVVDPADYPLLVEELNKEGGLTYSTRKRLSAKAFGHTARYDTLIHNYLHDTPMGDSLTLTFDRHSHLRYGENPHQQASAYADPQFKDPSILKARIHQGKKLSYNNIMDADGALACVQEFSEPACVVVKHANPCGAASGRDITDCFIRAFEADSLSAFGGIVALNRLCTREIAEYLRKIFIEIVLAPGYEPEAREIFGKKKNLRVLEVGEITGSRAGLEFRQVAGGLLLQEKNVNTVTREHLNSVTEAKPGDEQIDDMLFAWKVLTYVKSNAILTAKNHTTVGIGSGQVSRIDAVDIAVRKSGNRIGDTVLASDAFFPFRDSIDRIATTGIRAVIQPGGSVRDQEVIQACNEHGIAMVFTSTRCFRH
ncbi:MAG: bifunctional phosphoribosylaminoimidazolecarboxamide formyltransferase/IMP cyclohydrolase [Fidelibacterota bacterium]